MDTSNAPLKSLYWKDDYLRMIGSPDVSEIKIEAAQALKITNLPQHLYKYRCFDVYSLDNLENDTVWLNIPADYNDPFEAVEYLDDKRVLKALNIKMKDDIILQLTAQFPVPDEIIRRAQASDDPANIIGEHLFKEHNVASDDNIRSIFIALDENLKKIAIEKHLEKIKKIQNTMKVCSFCESPRKLLMWSHYANCHKGFCVEYDLSLWQPNDVRKRILYPVVYQNYFYDSTDHLPNRE